MKGLVQNISVVVIIASVCYASDVSSPNPHRQVLQRLSGEIISAAVVDDMKISSTTLVIDHGSPFDNIQQQLQQTLLAHGNQIFLPPAQRDTTLTVKRVESALSYGKPFSDSFFSSRRVARSVSVEIDIELHSTRNGQVLFSKQYSRVSIDTIFLSDVDRLNDPSVPFKSVRQPESTLFDSLLEPAIITVASAVAIYLFFTIRS